MLILIYSKILFFLFSSKQVFLDEIEYIAPLDNITVQVGREAIFNCYIKNAKKYKIVWVHIDNEMVISIHNKLLIRDNRFSTLYDNENTWTLQIKNVNINDAGFYLCQANNYPSLSTIGYLKVTVPPKIMDNETSESTVIATEYDTVLLQCKAVGNPKPKIIWRREDFASFFVDKNNKVKIYEGNKLILRQISREEIGAYLCIASNRVPPAVSKRFTIDVKFRPQIYIANQLIGVPLGKNVTIECIIDAFPKPKYYWIFKNNILRSSKKYFLNMGEKKAKFYSELTLYNISKYDYGQYKCVSENDVGEAEDTITIHEIIISESNDNEIKNVVKKTYNNPINSFATNTSKNSNLLLTKNNRISKINKKYSPKYFIVIIFIILILF